MARPKSFDESEVLQCAMLTFWRLGYDATTYRVLEGETGVGVRSMHNTFGEKDELFLKALEMYQAAARGVIDQIFNPPSAASIQMLFQGMVAPKDPEDVANFGCLMVNTVFEVPEPLEAIARRIEDYRSMWRDTFRMALDNSGIGKPDDRAEFLVGALWGVLSQIRLAGKTEGGAVMAQVISETVAGWQAE